LAEERNSVDSEDDEQLANASTDATESDKNADINTTVSFNYKDIPKYSGEPYVEINKGIVEPRIAPYMGTNTTNQMLNASQKRRKNMLC
jgi:hypothetical protein